MTRYRWWCQLLLRLGYVGPNFTGWCRGFEAGDYNDWVWRVNDVVVPVEEYSRQYERWVRRA